MVAGVGLHEGGRGGKHGWSAGSKQDIVGGKEWVGHSAGTAVATLRTWIVSPEQWETGDHSREQSSQGPHPHVS